MSKPAYMVVHQLNGNQCPYADSFANKLAAQGLFEEWVSNPGVSSAWIDEFTDAGRETIAIYHNKQAAKPVAAPAGALAADGAAAPVLASPFASVV